MTKTNKEDVVVESAGETEEVWRERVLKRLNEVLVEESGALIPYNEPRLRLQKINMEQNDTTGDTEGTKEDTGAEKSS